MAKAKRMIVLICVLFSTVGCDQATKSVAQSHLRASPSISFLNDVVRLQYAENPGAFLGLGAGLSETAYHWVFPVVAALVLVGLLLFALRASQTMPFVLLVAFALFLGGGISNLIDRLVHDGRVVDFMNVGLGSLRTGIFNVADMALMAGVILIALFSHRWGETAPTDQVDGKT